MADNVTANPGAGGETFASDEISGIQYPRVKVTFGADGVNDGDLSSTNPMPITALEALTVAASRTDDLIVGLSRLIKMLESNATVDQQQRQRITLDSITAGVALPTVTAVTTVAAVTAVTNVVANAGMDREQYINTAKLTYAQSIRSRLTFA
jgi:hypothetical protein